MYVVPFHVELSCKQILEQGVTDGIQSINLHCTCACACGHNHVPRVGSEVCICDELPRALALKVG